MEELGIREKVSKVDSDTIASERIDLAKGFEAFIPMNGLRRALYVGQRSWLMRTEEFVLEIVGCSCWNLDMRDLEGVMSYATHLVDN